MVLNGPKRAKKGLRKVQETYVQNLSNKTLKNALKMSQISADNL